MRNRLAPVLAVVVAASVALAGCSSKPGEQPVKPPVSSNKEPLKGGTLTVAIPGQVVSVDPHKQWDSNSMAALDNMVDTLMTPGPDNKLRPLLAESWSASPDGKVFTFKIRKGVKFHDGTELTAEAVKLNIERLLTDELKSPQKANWAKLDHLEAKDPETLVIYWQEPAIPDQFYLDTFWRSFIASPAAIEKLGADLSQNPAAAGPFKFESYQSDDRLVMSRFDGYWGGAPYLDKLVARIIPEANTRRVEMEAGTIDVLIGVEPKDVSPLEQKGIQIVRGPAPSMQAFAMNLNRAPFDDVKVREAVAHAIDKDALIKKVLYGYATTSATGTHPASPGAAKDITGFDYNVEKAKQLLEQAGWQPGPDGVRVKNGKKLAITIAARNDETWLLISQVAQESLKQIGFEVTIDSKDWGAFLDAMRLGNYDLGFWKLNSNTFEPSGYTWNLLSSSFWAVNQLNKSEQYKDLQKKVDDLINGGAQEMDETKRYAIYHDFQKTIVDNVLFIPLWHEDRLVAVQPWVQGLEVPTLVPFVRADKAWIDPDLKKK